MKWSEFSCGPRVSAGGLHFLFSAAIATVAALLVFLLWYPYPYREISSGRELFVLVISVDVLLGPLVTLVVFNSKKSRKELIGDLLVVGLIQLTALGYGLWTVALARPVHMVFEIDRFRVVHAVDVDETLLLQTPQSIRALPVTGPTLLALRPFKNDQERIDATFAALQGVSLASRPDFWRPYEEAIPDVLKEAKPATRLLSQFAANAAEIESALAEIGRRPSEVVYLPLVGRKSYWTVFLDPITAQVLTTIPLDSF